LRGRKPGKSRSKTEARPETALSDHQEVRWVPFEFVGGIAIAAA
jgi:hypothetical protein